MPARTRQPNPATSSETRTRLLEAAGSVFAERGFRDATIREICHLAHANIAGVNYHFGGKEQLYSAVLLYVDDQGSERNPYLATGSDSKIPEARLRWFVRQFLGRVFDTGRPAWHEQLMMREMTEPTRALDDLVERNIRPRSLVLRAIIADFLGPRASESLIQRCAASIVGQCLFYWHCKPVIARLMPDIDLDSANVESLADHITRFSLGALDALRLSPSPRFSSSPKGRTSVARGAASKASKPLVPAPFPHSLSESPRPLGGRSRSNPSTSAARSARPNARPSSTGARS